MSVIICGLGPAGLDGLTVGALEAMRTHKTFLRTSRHDAADYLEKSGIEFESFDALYDACEDFDALCGAICETLYVQAQAQDVVYAVASGAGFCDATVQVLCAFMQERDMPVRMLPGVGYFESAALHVGGLDGAVVLSAQALEEKWIHTKLPLILCEVDNRLLACDAKVLLLDHYPQTHRVYSVLDGQTKSFPLGELDRQKAYSHRLCIVIPPVDILALSRYDFTRLLDIAAILRGRSDDFEGCPWDMEQTHTAMRGDMLEEAYEAVDAIDRDDIDQLCEELGDVLLQVVLHAQIAGEYDEFTAQDVITGVCAKMIRRHPHVFGETQVDSSAQVLKNWDAIKQGETHADTPGQKMALVPKALPALIRAGKVLKRAGETPKQLEQALGTVSKLDIGDEESLGQVLFALVLAARQKGLDAEHALSQAVDRLIHAYRAQESAAQ